MEHAGTAVAVPPPGLSDHEWVLRCPACGHLHPLAGAGVRFGAASVGKRILARCPNCGFFGLTSLIRAKQAREEKFEPDPHVRERQGRAFAVAGALLNVVPIVLVILAVWPTWRVAEAWPEFEEGYGALRPDSRQLITALLVPAATAAAAALGLTLTALWASRYRAPWFFRWLISYGFVTSPALIGVVILGYCFSRREEFLAERDNAASRDDASPELRAARRHGMSSSSRVLVATVICFVVMLFAAVCWAFGNRVSPLAIVVLAAAIAGAYRLGTRIETDRPLRSAGGARPFPWQVPVIVGVMAIPFAAVLAVFAGPWVRQFGFSYSAGVAAAFLLPVLFAFYSALIVTAFRALARTSAPRWIAGLVAVFLTLLLPAAMLWSSTYAPVGHTSLFQPPSGPSAYDLTPVVTVVKAQQPPFTANWAQGSVELIAITRHPSAKHAWWRMDGSQATEGPFINRGNHVSPGPDDRAYEFYFRVRNLPAGASGPEWIVQDARSSSSGGIPSLVEAPDRILPGYHLVATALPAELITTNVKAGLSYEPWHTVSVSHPLNSTETTVSHQGVSWKITHGSASETKGGELVVTFNYPRHSNWETRVIPVTHEDVEAPRGTLSRVNNQATWKFSRLSLREVKEFRFQVRPIRWVEFRGVALRPSF